MIGLDGKSVIIFGGTFNSNNFTLPTPGDSLYELSLLNFEWAIPNISGPVPDDRFGHKANVIGKYMVISFGKYIL